MDDSVPNADCTLFQDDLDESITERKKDLGDKIDRLLKGESVDQLFPREEGSSLTEDDDLQVDFLSIFPDSVRKSLSRGRESTQSMRADKKKYTDLFEDLKHTGSGVPRLAHDRDICNVLPENLPDFTQMDPEEGAEIIVKLATEAKELEQVAVNESIKNFRDTMNRSLDFLNSKVEEVTQQLAKILDESDSSSQDIELPEEVKEFYSRIKRIVEIESKTAKAVKELASAKDEAIKFNSFLANK